VYVCVCVCVCVRLVYLGGGVCILVLVINSSGVRPYSVVIFFCVEVASYFAHKQSFRVWEIPTITFPSLVVEHNFFLCFASYFFSPLWRNSGLLNSTVYGFIVSLNALVSVYCRHTKYSYTSFPFIQLSQVSLQ
jgi:hypothetical protein